MYRCSKCRRRTEDIDVAPCKQPADHPFSPEEIVTIHHFTMNPIGQRILSCTGKPARPGAISLGGRYGITCIRCKTAMRPKPVAKESSLPETTEPPKEPSLPESGDVDKIPDNE